jgi:hypothetical protein
MRIAFDLDGVLADLHTAYVRAALMLFPDVNPALVASASAGASPPTDEGTPHPDIPVAPVERHPDLSPRQARAVWATLCAQENFWETLDEIEAGAVARIADVAARRRWEVIFLTSRPTAPGHTVQRQTQRWLAQHGFALPSVFVVQQARGAIAAALKLDVVIDDRPEGCLDVVLESKARSVLIWRGDETTVSASARRLGVGVVPSVSACLDVLIQADAEGDPPGMVTRLKRLLGLRMSSAD